MAEKVVLEESGLLSGRGCWGILGNKVVSGHDGVSGWLRSGMKCKEQCSCDVSLFRMEPQVSDLSFKAFQSVQLVSEHLVRVWMNFHLQILKESTIAICKDCVPSFGSIDISICFRWLLWCTWRLPYQFRVKGSSSGICIVAHVPNSLGGKQDCSTTLRDACLQTDANQLS
eukprot:4375162-Amphidinium_carterae.1